MKSELKWLGLLGAGLLCIVFVFLCTSLSILNALQWLAQAVLLWLWAWSTAWQKREHNRLNADAPLLASLGWANRLTLLRGYLIALTGGFLFLPQVHGLLSWAPGLLYGAAAMLDRLDGFVARKTKQTTRLGAELDMAFDAFGLFVVPVLALWLGKIHWSYLLLSFAFYIFQFGLLWRKKCGLINHAILPSQLRRALAGFQMGFIALVLFPCFQPAQTVLCSGLFMFPVLLGFAVDWLVVTGRINGQSHNTEHFFIGATALSTTFFQPALRVLLAFGVAYLVSGMDLTLLSAPTALALKLSLGLGLVLVLLGLAGRVGALLILLALGVYPLLLNGVSILVLCSAVALLLLGTGRFSVWQWDDVWVNRQDGASA